MTIGGPTGAETRALVRDENAARLAAAINEAFADEDAFSSGVSWNTLIESLSEGRASCPA
jgi:hypothetical protein